MELVMTDSRSQVMPTNLITTLRGVAIAAVVLFHFNIQIFSQGFLGVDIFFWISGYLLIRKFIQEYETNRLNSKSDRGWIDIRLYFIRRIRRIFPTVIVFLMSYSFLKLIIDGQQSILEIKNQILHILTFTFNVQLISNETNYFESFYANQELKHFWSLSVEEQIYIVLPIIFALAVNRHGLYLFTKRVSWLNRVFLSLISLSIVSFGFSYFGEALDFSSNLVFYSSFTRFWQFGLGGIVAVIESKNIMENTDPFRRRGVALVSCLLGTSFFFFTSTNGYVFKSVFILVCLSIFYLSHQDDPKRKQTINHNLLFVRTLNFLGRISFPLYLLHWPITSRASTYDISTVPLFQIAGMTISVVGAYILHRFVEAPALKFDISRFAATRRSRTNRNLFGDRVSRLIMAFGVLSYFTLLGYFSSPVGFTEKFSTVKSYLLTDSAMEIVEPTVTLENENSTTSSGEGGGVSSSLQSDSSTTADEFNLNPSNSTSKFKDSIVNFDAKWRVELQAASRLLTLPLSYTYDQKTFLEKQKNDWENGCLNTDPSISNCIYGAGSKVAVLLGDSYAFALLPAIKSALPDGWKLIVMTRGSCLPWAMAGLSPDSDMNSTCISHNLTVIESVKMIQPELVIFSAADKLAPNQNFGDWSSGIDQTIATFRELAEKIVIIPGTPGSGNLLKCVKSDRDISGCFGRRDGVKRFVGYQLSKSGPGNVHVIDLTPYLCDGEYCPPVIKGLPVYVDGDHLSAAFSRELGSVLRFNRLFGK